MEGAINQHYGAVTIQHSTIYGNNAAFTGGGVDIVFGSIRVQNSLIAGNTAASGGDVDIYDGSFFSDGYNIFSSFSDFFPLSETDQLARVDLGEFDEELGILKLSPLMVDVIPEEACVVTIDAAWYRSLAKRTV